MEGLIYKDNVSKLPPLSPKKRTKIASPHNTCKAPCSKVGLLDSSDMSQIQDAYRCVKPVNRAHVRNNMAFRTPSASTPNTEESCRQLSYIILQQLATVEHQNALIHDKLIYNEQKIGSIVDEVSHLKKKISDVEDKLQKQTDVNSSADNCCKKLLEKCDNFEQKIRKMEEIMVHHQLQSMGDDLNSGLQNSENKAGSYAEKEDATSQWVPESSVPTMDSTVDFGKVLRAVKELNVIAGEGESKMCYTRNGATFQRSAGIPLTLYANGLILYNGSFRSYDEESTRQFLQDILDGYFPSEFQNDYPDGVPLQIEDKHEIVYEEQKSWSAFSGKGYKLGHGVQAVMPGKSSSSRLLREFSKSK